MLILFAKSVITLDIRSPNHIRSESLSSLILFKVHKTFRRKIRLPLHPDCHFSGSSHSIAPASFLLCSYPIHSIDSSIRRMMSPRCWIVLKIMREKWDRILSVIRIFVSFLYFIRCLLHRMRSL
jgi:hypothetical protein